MKFKILTIILSASLLVSCATQANDKSNQNDNSDQGNVTVNQSYKQISQSEAAEIMQIESGYIILDVRRADEFAEGHIKGAVNIPNESIGDGEIDALPDKNQLILVYCRSGNRSKQASEKLAQLGYTNIVEFGGILDWKGEIVKPDNADESTPEKEVDLTADFTVYTSDIKELKLSSFFGKPIVVNFFATWCPPCKAELPFFNSLYEKYKDDVVFVMVNVDDANASVISTVENFVSENGYTFPVYYDLEYSASLSYNVSAIPETFFINADGSLKDSHLGYISEDILENFIKEMTSK